MKKLVVIIVIIVSSLAAYSQEIFLCGRIEGFDILSNTQIDRPVDILKIKGTLILEKENLVIHTRRKGKDWILDYRLLSVNERVRQKDHTIIDFTYRDNTDAMVEGSLRINEDETWSLDYKTDKTKTNFTGITLKQELFNKRRR